MVVAVEAPMVAVGAAPLVAVGAAPLVVVGAAPLVEKAAARMAEAAVQAGSSAVEGVAASKVMQDSEAEEVEAQADPCQRGYLSAAPASHGGTSRADGGAMAAVQTEEQGAAAADRMAERVVVAAGSTEAVHGMTQPAWRAQPARRVLQSRWAQPAQRALQA
jgi:hypothetical protein